jgi:hypothetical protein
MLIVREVTYFTQILRDRIEASYNERCMALLRRFENSIGQLFWVHL